MIISHQCLYPYLLPALRICWHKFLCMECVDDRFLNMFSWDRTLLEMLYYAPKNEGGRSYPIFDCHMSEDFCGANVLIASVPLPCPHTQSYVMWLSHPACTTMCKKCVVGISSLLLCRFLILVSVGSRRGLTVSTRRTGRRWAGGRTLRRSVSVDGQKVALRRFSLPSTGVPFASPGVCLMAVGSALVGPALSQEGKALSAEWLQSDL